MASAQALPETSSPPPLPPVLAHDVAPRHGHTERDFAELLAAGVDPDTTQPRDHQVRCVCGRMTLNQSAGCDRPGCYVLPGAVQRARHAAENGGDQ